MPNAYWLFTIITLTSFYNLSCMEEMEKTPLLDVATIALCSLCEKEITSQNILTLACGHTYHEECSKKARCCPEFTEEYMDYHDTQPTTEELLPSQKKRACSKRCTYIFGDSPQMIALSSFVIVMLVGDICLFAVVIS